MKHHARSRVHFARPGTRPSAGAVLLVIGVMGLAAGGSGVAGAAAPQGGATIAEGRARIAAAPQEPAGYLIAAQALRAAGDLDGAVRLLAEGRAKATPSAPLLAMLGGLLVQQNRLADAEATTRAALEVDPRHLDAHLQLARIYERLDWHSSAAECYRRVLELAPAHREAQEGLAAALLAARQPRAAEEACRGILAGDPERPAVWIALGEALEQQERLREAFASYGRAVALDAGSGGAHSRRARLYCRFAQFEAAALECRAALAIDPDDPLAHAYLGIAATQLGQAETARAHALRAEAAGMNMDAVWRQIGR